MIPKFRKLVPRLIKKMKVVISGGFKSEYNVGGVPDPFLQVEMLKLLCFLATNDHDCSDMLGDLLAFVGQGLSCYDQIATKTDSSCMAGNAVLYETVKTIMNIDAVSGQRVLGANILGKFLLHRRALEVVFALVNLKNVEELVRELLNYLVKEKRIGDIQIMADDTERPELISKITSLVQQFAPSSLWQVDTLLAVLQVSGKYANEEVTSALISIIGNEEEELSSYTVFMNKQINLQIHKLFMFLQKDQSQVSLTQVGVWFIGEYGEELLEAYYDQVRQQQLDAVSEEKVLDLLASILNSNSIDSTTKSEVLEMM